MKALDKMPGSWIVFSTAGTQTWDEDVYHLEETPTVYAGFRVVYGGIDNRVGGEIEVQTGPIDRETGKISGFSFIHSDSNTPAIPTSFDAPEYAGK